MENLNAEQILQGLRDNDSPYKTDQDNIRDAIKLIKSQEQRIKELTEEIERLEQRNKILEAKNERLEIICNSYGLQYGTVADKEVFLKEERTDTVRKMQNEIEALFPSDKEFTTISRFTLRQIAKEISEGNE